MKDDAALIDILRELTAALTDREFCDVIDRLKSLGPTSATAAMESLSGIPVNRIGHLSIHRLVREVLPGYPDLSASGLSTLFSVSRKMSSDTQGPSVEIVWTGPKSLTVPSRRTEQVLLDLMSGAKREVLIVSFAIYRADSVLVALKDASERGIKVTLVAESCKEDNGTTSFDMIGGLRERIGNKVRILEWPPEIRDRDEKGRIGALHAKCLIIDREKLFVSSANLTEYALSRNMELGLLVTDRNTAERVAMHFDSLDMEGILRPGR